MSIEQHIENLLTPSLNDKGFGIVRLQLQGNMRKTLQLMIERLDGSNITMEDCALVSRTASVLLDVDDPIQESYTLEVSSPGLDRPLTKKADFERFAGSLIKIELRAPFQGSRRFQGLLKGIEGDTVKVQLIPLEGEEKFNVAEFAFSDIQKAKIIPNFEKPDK